MSEQISNYDDQITKTPKPSTPAITKTAKPYTIEPNSLFTEDNIQILMEDETPLLMEVGY